MTNFSIIKNNKKIRIGYINIKRKSEEKVVESINAITNRGVHTIAFETKSDGEKILNRLYSELHKGDTLLCYLVTDLYTGCIYPLIDQRDINEAYKVNDEVIQQIETFRAKGIRIEILSRKLIIDNTHEGKQNIERLKELLAKSLEML